MRPKSLVVLFGCLLLFVLVGVGRIWLRFEESTDFAQSLRDSGQAFVAGDLYLVNVSAHHRHS